MDNGTRVIDISVGELREVIRGVVREEWEQLKMNANPVTEYRDSDRLSIMQVAGYLGVCRKTVDNYRSKQLIPEPEFNLSGKARWTVAQLKVALNQRKAKQKFPVS